MNEFEYVKDIAQGARGARAKLVQECLVHHQFRVVVDGKFGPATRTAVALFQSDRGLAPTGVVNRPCFDALVAPFLRVQRAIDVAGHTLGTLTVAYAQQHLAEHPIEIGGANRGPWVRLYMGGLDGDAQLWCAGFVCFCLDQACNTLGVDPPIDFSVSCDALAQSAKREDRFTRDATQAQPGSLFLLRGTVPGDWIHVGIVTGIDVETFSSIEGNTNEQGSRNGFEVCARTRGFALKDFIRIDG